MCCARTGTPSGRDEVGCGFQSYCAHYNAAARCRRATQRVAAAAQRRSPRVLTATTARQRCGSLSVPRAACSRTRTAYLTRASLRPQPLHDMEPGGETPHRVGPLTKARSGCLLPRHPRPPPRLAGGPGPAGRTRAAHGVGRMYSFTRHSAAVRSQGGRTHDQGAGQLGGRSQGATGALRMYTTTLAPTRQAH